MTYGYVRVSTKEQNEDRQLKALYDAGITTQKIFVDKQSGKGFERPSYQKLVRLLKKDDVVYIKSIDRLGRDYEEILEQWRILTKQKYVDIVVLDMPLLDTRRGKDLIGTFVTLYCKSFPSWRKMNVQTFIRGRWKASLPPKHGVYSLADLACPCQTILRMYALVGSLEKSLAPRLQEDAEWHCQLFVIRHPRQDLRPIELNRRPKKSS